MMTTFEIINATDPPTKIFDKDDLPPLIQKQRPWRVRRATRAIFLLSFYTLAAIA